MSKTHVSDAVVEVLENYFGKTVKKVELISKHRPYGRRKPYDTIKAADLTDWEHEILVVMTTIAQNDASKSSGLAGGQYETGLRVWLADGERKWVPADTPLFENVKKYFPAGKPADKRERGRVIAALVQESGDCEELAWLGGFGQTGGGCQFEASDWLDLWSVPEDMERNNANAWALADEICTEAAEECGVYVDREDVFRYICREMGL